jgi:hypothetical protein
MIFNELKTRLFLLNTLKHLKLLNQNQTTSISIFTTNKNSNEKILNNKTNSINNDWFQKLTAKSSKISSTKIDFESLSQEEKRKLIIEVWEIEKEKGLRPMPKTLKEKDLDQISKTAMSKSDIVSSLM